MRMDLAKLYLKSMTSVEVTFEHPKFLTIPHQSDLEEKFP